MKRLAFLIALTASVSSVLAQTNKGLDHSFGNGGIARTDIYTNKNFRNPTGLIIQPDGKMLISGEFIGRFKTNGTPDSSFGVNGFLVTPFTDLSAPIKERARAIALQADGKILIAGKPDSGCSFIARLLPDGGFDSSFGRHGMIKNRRLNPWHLKVQPDGKIILVGNGCGIISSSDDSVTVARFLPDGAVDTSFGKGGYAQVYLGIYGGSIAGVGILPDGRIAMGGMGYDSARKSKTIVIRFLANGKLDTSFGGTGVIYPFYTWYCHAFAVMSDGRVLLTVGNLDAEDVARLTANGSHDTTFGANGFATIDNQGILSIIPLRDGRILCGGPSNGDFRVGCLQPNGKGLDASFGQNGIITTDITGYWSDRLVFLALQPDNRIVAFGDGLWDKSIPTGVMLVRYNANAATGIHSLSNHSGVNLSVYPNPAQATILLSGVPLSQLASISITTTDGRLVKHIAAPASLTIPVGGYTPGLYLLHVRLKNGEMAGCRFMIAE